MQGQFETADTFRLADTVSGQECALTAVNASFKELQMLGIKLAAKRASFGVITLNLCALGKPAL